MSSTASRPGPKSLFEAIDLAAADKARWTAADLRARATRALAEAEAHGDRRAAHPCRLDRAGAAARLGRARRSRRRLARPGARSTARRSSRSTCSATPISGPAIAAEVAAADGVLGAFVYRNDHLPEKLERVFALAERHELLLDFHVDEGLDREAQGFDTIVALTARRRLGGRVLCGHACSLAVRPEAEVAPVLDARGEAGVALTVLPTTNAYLQDARHGRTPRLRGLAPMHEARAAGMPVLVALDNVRDAFYPYGEYDLLDAWRQAVLAAPSRPRRLARRDHHAPRRARSACRPPRLAPGEPADFLLIDGDRRPTTWSTRARPAAPGLARRAGRSAAAPSPGGRSHETDARHPRRAARRPRRRSRSTTIRNTSPPSPATISGTRRS